MCNLFLRIIIIGNNNLRLRSKNKTEKQTNKHLSPFYSVAHRTIATSRRTVATVRRTFATVRRTLATARRTFATARHDVATVRCTVTSARRTFATFATFLIS